MELVDAKMKGMTKPPNEEHKQEEDPVV